MRRLRPSQIESLKQAGVVIENAGLQPKPREKPTPPPQVQPEPPRDIAVQVELPDLPKFLNSQAEITRQVVGINNRIAEILENLAAPKDKRQFDVLIGRDGRGNISTFRIEEK